MTKKNHPSIIAAGNIKWIKPAVDEAGMPRTRVNLGRLTDYDLSIGGSEKGKQVYYLKFSFSKHEGTDVIWKFTSRKEAFDHLNFCDSILHLAHRPRPAVKAKPMDDLTDLI